MTSLLKKDRLETALPDKKPLYSSAEARAEAERCLYCVDAPCIKACPTEIDIPTFIKKIATGNTRGAASTIFDQNLLGYSCARVCPVEVLCVGDCVYNGWGRDPINIGRLQRFATETAVDHPAKNAAPLRTPKPKIGKKVACIGAGPASLAFAGYLALEGFDADVFEKRSVAGGLNTTGIAPYKLQAEDALHEVAWVESFGVQVKTGIEIGKDIKAEDLVRDYEAVFLGVGLGEDTKLGIPGEDGPSLTRDDAKSLGRVLVIGGGNTAIDVARECAGLGAADVAMVYRRSQKEMSGYAHELEGARLEGVRFVENAVPHSFVRDAGGKLVALRVSKAEGGKPIAGTEHDIPCDLVTLAIGQSKLRSLATQFAGVELDAKGCVKADRETGKTGNPKVYAGGDCINGGKEVVNAVADGRNAARDVLAKLSKGS